MKKKLVALFAVVSIFAGCSGATSGAKVGDTYIYYTHDSEHGVGIWQASGGSISVLPDSQYKH